MEKKPCGLPPKFPVNSGLRTKEDESITVPDAAAYKCRQDGKVTDLGQTIELKCVIKPGEENATFIYPDGWGTQASKCRLPEKCRPPFEAPLETGLTLIVQNESYYEFDFASYE